MGVKRGRGSDVIAADVIYHKSMGAQQLVPQKFRRQLKTTILTGPVEVDYSFPKNFTGDQIFIDLKQNTGQYEGATLTTVEEELLTTGQLVSYRRTGDAQTETLNESLVLETDPPPPLSALVTSMEQNAIGDGKAVRILGTVPTVFPNERWEINRPRVTPSEFIALIPTQEYTYTAAGTAGPVTLGPNELSAFDEQIDVYRHRRKSGTQNLALLPITITGSRTTKEKQVEHIEKTLQLDTIAPALPTATLDVTWQKLGDGTAVEEHDFVDSLYTNGTYDVEIPDVIPHKFKATLPTKTETIISQGTAGPPTLLTGELKRTSEQVNVFVKKDTRMFRDVALLPITLTEYKLTGKLQLSTATATLAVGLQTITPGALTIDAAVENLGNNTSLKTEETVASLFTEPTFEASIPDRIPEKFRSITPTLRTSALSIGTAAQPTLVTGELSHTSDQVNVFVKKDTSIYRDVTVLPVSLTDSRLTPQKQIATVVMTLNTGVQTITANELTMEAEVENLGNNTTLKTVSTVPTLFSDNSFEASIPDRIPEKFRPVTPTLRTSSLSAGTAAAPTLITGELSHTQDQVNVFVKRDTSVYRDVTSLPVSLTEYKMTAQRQLETVVATLATGLQTITPDSLTVEASVDNLGNNLSLLTLGTVPIVFPDYRYAQEKPDPVPQEFRSIVPTDTVELTLAGTPSPPTLTSGQLSKSDEQVTAFTHRTRLTTRDVTVLPVTLTGSRTTRNKQVETVDRILELDSATPLLPTALRDVTFTDIGAGMAIEERAYVPALFPNESFGKTIPDPIPEKFKVLVPTRRHEIFVTGTAAADRALATGELSYTSEQVNAFVLRETSSGRDATSLPVSLTEYKLTGKKQIATVVSTLATGLQTITGVSELTTEANVDNLGNNTSLQIFGAVSSLFTSASYSREIPITIPERFRPAVPIVTTSIESAGTAADSGLGTGEFEHSEEQVDAYTKRTRIRGIGSVTLPVSMVHYRYRKAEGRIETITETLAAGLQTLTGITALTTEGDVQNLGNGTSIKSEATIPSLFLRKVSSKRIEDIIPREFKGVVPTFMTEQDVVGTINDPPTLGFGDLEVTETQINDYTKRVRRETRDPSLTLPVTLTGGKKLVEKFGVQLVADRIVTLANTGTLSIPALGPRVIEAEINEIGSGLEILTSLVTHDAAWPVLLSRLYDEEMRVLYNEERQIVDPATVPPTPAPTATFLEEIKAIDSFHSWRIRTTKVPTASAANPNISYVMKPYTFPGRFDAALAHLVGGVVAHKTPHSSLVRVTVKQWWVIGPTAPILNIPEIITNACPWWDQATQPKPDMYDDCLNDAYGISLYGTFYSVPASVPSLSAYLGSGGFLPATITWTNGSFGVTGKNTSFIAQYGAALAQPGSYIYAPDGGSFQAKVSSNTLISLTGPGYNSQQQVQYPPYRGPTTTYSTPSNVPAPPGTVSTGWVGNERVIGATVEPDRQPNLWRVTTHSVIMR